MAKRGTNSIDPEALKEFADRVFALQDELDGKRAEIMSDIKEVYTEAADKLNVKRTLLREAVQERRKELKKQKKDREREAQDLNELENLRDLLGDFGTLPLGAHAIEAAAE